MYFITDTNLQQQNNEKLLKCTPSVDGFTDAWVSEGEVETLAEEGGMEVKISENGLFGVLERRAHADDVQEVTRKAYLDIFAFFSRFPSYTLTRVWNYVPSILQYTDPSGECNVYHLFNAGRYLAFSQQYKGFPENVLIPAASAVGCEGDHLRIEFLAVKGEVMFLENKDQVPSKKYSEKYGTLPPLFSRGVIYRNVQQTVLLSSGTASVVGEDSKYDDLYDQVNQTILNLRVLASQFNLKGYGIDYGFALEDVALMRVYYKNGEDLPFLKSYLKKVLAPQCLLSFRKADICRDELLVEMEALFVKKGESEKNDRPKYYLENGTVRTESFELHIAEHCNLRCRDCCNISPFNPEKFLSVKDVEEICRTMSRYIKPDLFKIAGGEPTLHPEIDKIILTVKESGISDAVRVVSNGLLMHRMTEVFWSNIDQLTISNYTSAPVKPAMLALIKEKSRQYGIVLNIKYIDQFNEIFVEERIDEAVRVQEIYNDCWMRHRCHIVRNGYFYKCTRAAYMDDYLPLLKKDNSLSEGTYSRLDGIPLDDPDFGAKVLHYLNDQVALNSCSYCLGVSGKLRENVQLPKKEVDRVVGGKRA